MPTKFPAISVGPSCCIRRFHKQISGARVARYSRPYRCDGGSNVSGRMQIRLRITIGECDEDQDPAGANLVPNGSSLDATGQIVKRADGFAKFVGKFAIRRPSGIVDVLRGELILLDRVGSHEPPFGNEPCNMRHVEGWLQGVGVGSFSSFSIHAVLVARGVLPRASASRMSGIVNGSIMKCP